MKEYGAPPRAREEGYQLNDVKCNNYANLLWERSGGCCWVRGLETMGELLGAGRQIVGSK